MRISDWSSDVCSSDLICWSIGPVFLKTGRALEFVPHAAAEEPRRSNQPLRPVAVDRINLVGEIANIGKYRPAGIRRQFAAQAEQRIGRSEEHTSELQSLMRNSYAVFFLKKKTTTNT